MGIDLDSYRKESLENWNRTAAGWETRREWVMSATAPVTNWLVEKIDAQPGETVLEIAAGTGDLGLRIAQQLGSEGRVLSTDFAPGMLDVARRQGSSLGIENVDYLVLDAEKMDLEDGSVDAAVCRFGYMLMADPAAALGETRRVLRDGGRLAFAVWSTADRNPWAAVAGMTLVKLGYMPPPEQGAPGVFALGDPSRIRELVTGAGFSEPEIEEIAFEYRYADADDYWDSILRLAGSLARLVGDLSQDQRKATRDAIQENLAPYRNDDGSYTASAMSWGVFASRNEPA
jgi:SAM-dependent methyltransferase